jgi:acyl transferase domain-containing protein/acyl carrier protein
LEEQEMPVTAAISAPKTGPAGELQSWLVSQVAAMLKVSVQKIDVRTSFAHYGMDSLQAVSLSSDLGDWLGRELPPTLFYDYPNIETLVRHLARERSHQGTSSTEQRDTTEEAIAIIGLGCRFPGAKNPQEFWHMLRDGGDGISEVPAQRWDLHQYYAAERATPGKMNTRWGGFLEDVDQFDPYFFGIAPREASRMDPQQRILLEVAWESLENAGLAIEKLAGSQTGVFIGISSNDYAHLLFHNPAYASIRERDPYAGTGNAQSIAANRLSYCFDLRGPSIAIDTACSSSLVALHLACQSLRNGECDLALAGGVNLILMPDLTITFAQARMLSSAGRCKTFDDAADGYVRSEGCGLVVLKGLAAALRDGDNILALIRGSALNQDGRSNGLTAPNGPAQEAVIRQALCNASVTADQISYVETHGSSTPLGDPIEFDALKAVLMQDRKQDQTCVLGSVKTNIGHLEAAAGIAGLIKTVLSLQHGEIPRHLHLKRLNRHITLAGTTFVIPTRRQPWPVSTRRLAGVSAFGFGGTNVHVIVEEAPPVGAQLTSPTERNQHILTLSARSEQTLSKCARRYEEFLATSPEVRVADVCYTANSVRSHFMHRMSVIAGSTEQLRMRLAAYVDGKKIEGIYHRGSPQEGGRPGIVFLFTGQGSQYRGMACQLYKTQPTFRNALDRCAAILRPYLKVPLLSVLYPEAGSSSLLDETVYTQPALFALEYALAEMWRSWGIEPDVVMGHSVGEYVAACVAGVFSLEDGLKLIAERGRLMQDLPQRGEMAVVFAEQTRVVEALVPYCEQVSIAALNGPQNTVISGESKAVQAIVQHLEAEGLTTHPMTVSHAFHSPLMEPMLAAFAQVAQQVQYMPLRVPLVCNLKGHMLAAGAMLDAGYWRQQVRESVQFVAGMQTLAEHGYHLFVEIGPHAVLSTLGKRCLSGEEQSWLPSLRQGHDEWQVLLESTATLYVKGVNLDWSGFDRDYVRHKLALPTYPFEREYCWLESTVPLLGAHMELVYPAGVHAWETVLGRERLPYLNDHRIQGVMAVPVSLYIELALAATMEVFGEKGAYILTEIELKKLLFLPEKGSQRIQVILATGAYEQVSFQIYSPSVGVRDQPRHLWTLHVSGKIRRDTLPGSA